MLEYRNYLQAENYLESVSLTASETRSIEFEIMNQCLPFCSVNLSSKISDGQTFTCEYGRSVTTCLTLVLDDQNNTDCEYSASINLISTEATPFSDFSYDVST